MSTWEMSIDIDPQQSPALWLVLCVSLAFVLAITAIFMSATGIVTSGS